MALLDISTENQYGDIIAVPAGSVPLLSMALSDRD